LSFRLRQYKKEVNEETQPHVRVYKMSISARDRAETNDSNSRGISCPLDVPSPDIKHRLLGDILELRLNAMRYSDLLQLANRLSSLDGCKEDATPFYKDIIKKCEVFLEISGHRRSESERRLYHSLTVEILLLQVQFISLLLRAGQSVRSFDESRTAALRNTGLAAVSKCQEYFQIYPSCGIYESAADRAKEMLQSTSHFYQAVSMEERKAIVQAMNADFHGTGHWYTCRNGHPFSVGECGRPMEATRCPECGEPVGGAHHTPAAGVTHERSFDAFLR